MSNRTLIEINHDYGPAMARNLTTVGDIIAEGVRGGFTKEVCERLRPFGIRVFGTRHHSDAFAIDWAGRKSAEPSTPKS